MATPRYGFQDDALASPQRRVFRRLVQIARDDAALQRIFGASWTVWDGSDRDRRDVALSECPAIRLTPSMGSEEFYGPGGFIGDLIVDIDIAVAGTDVDDPLDLYWAVRRAFYPPDAEASAAIHRALVAAGAEAEYVLQFTQPSFFPVIDGDDAFVVATGRMQIRVREDVL